MNTEKSITKNRALIQRLSAPLSPLSTGMKEVGEPLTGIRAVLFDVYGTLLISGSGDVGTVAEGKSSKAMWMALASSGWMCNEAQAVEATLRMRLLIEETHQKARNSGVTYPEVEIRAIWKELLADFEGTKRLSIEATAINYECRMNPVWLMPGWEETLTWIRERSLSSGIVSNAQFYTPLILDVLTGQTLESLGFDPLLCSWSYRAGCAKPSVQLFEPPLQELKARGIQPSEVLYIGNDLLNDVWTASACGCRTLLFAGDRRSLRLREEDACCQNLQPDGVITALKQITRRIL